MCAMRRISLSRRGKVETVRRNAPLRESHNPPHDFGARDALSRLVTTDGLSADTQEFPKGVQGQLFVAAVFGEEHGGVFSNKMVIKQASLVVDHTQSGVLNGVMTKQANRIRELRATLGLSQRLLADAVNTTAQQIDRLEKGERSLTVAWMRRLAIPLRVSPEAIMGGAEQPQNDFKQPATARWEDREHRPVSPQSLSLAYAMIDLYGGHDLQAFQKARAQTRLAGYVAADQEAFEPEYYADLARIIIEHVKKHTPATPPATWETEE